MKTAFSIAIVTFCLFATSITNCAFGQITGSTVGTSNRVVPHGVTDGWYEETSNPSYVWVDSRIFNSVMSNKVLYTYWYPASNGIQKFKFRRVVNCDGKSSNIRGQLHMLVKLARRTEIGVHRVAQGGGHVVSGQGGSGHSGGIIADGIGTGPNFTGVFVDTAFGATITVRQTGANTYSWSSNNGYTGRLYWNGSTMNFTGGVHSNGSRLPDTYSKKIHYSGRNVTQITLANGHAWKRR